MSDVLLVMTRGPLVENMVRGHIAVVDKSGSVIASCGLPETVTYMRSAAKPLQASAAVENRVLAHFGINEEELAVMCASHNGEAGHVSAVESILGKIGLSEDALTLGPALSYDAQLREQQLAAGIAPRRIYNNCSGKHACMLALCQYYGWDIRAYQQLQHPVQQLILSVVAAYAELAPAEIITGVDGCGVPVFALPLTHMARAYRNLANPEQLPAARAAAAAQITSAMGQYPDIVAGSGRFCSALIRVTKGRLISKMGADGIYCCAPLAGGIGISLKVEDGKNSAVPLIIVRALTQLDLLTQQEREALADFASHAIINCQKEKVGEIRAVFELNFS